MRNSLRNLHVTMFSCLFKLFYFSVVLLFFLYTFMVNKDEYNGNTNNINSDEYNFQGIFRT